jgi:glucose-6-phosphate 1-epimerase
MNLPFPIPGCATLADGLDGLTRLRITTASGEAEIVLQGAHVTHFQPAGAGPVLFISRSSFFAPGKPIRGGIPVCFPWFAGRAGHPELPAHGFARVRIWEVESLTETNRSTTAVIRLASDEQTRALWPHEFVARLRVEVGSQLTLTLEVGNTGTTPFQFEEALHTYFQVADVREVAVTGLEDAAYLDKTDGQRRKVLGAEPLRLTAETDRIFPGSKADCVLDDPGLKRRIVIEKSGSKTTVVWNPWVTKAAAMPDFGDDEWPQMLCIETANAGDDAITLAPGARHAMTTTIRLG